VKVETVYQGKNSKCFQQYIVYSNNDRIVMTRFFALEKLILVVKIVKTSWKVWHKRKDAF